MEDLEQGLDDDGLAAFPDGRVMCTICGRTLSSMGTGRRHFKESHLPNKEAVCKICKRVFKNQRKANDHLKSSHGISSRMMKTIYKVNADPGHGQDHDGGIVDDERPPEIID